MRLTVLSLVAALALAGCTRSVPLDLSGVDPRALQGCGPARAKVGEDPAISARRKELARRCEASRRSELATFIRGIGR